MLTSTFQIRRNPSDIRPWVGDPRPTFMIGGPLDIFDEKLQNVHSHILLRNFAAFPEDTTAIETLPLPAIGRYSTTYQALSGKRVVALKMYSCDGAQSSDDDDTGITTLAVRGRILKGNAISDTWKAFLSKTTRATSREYLHPTGHLFR